ncbi:MAG TPA: sugar transferase [Phycisphaerae bacterium]|nr:sugar transferase [Phycisphaerae bacterium]
MPEPLTVLGFVAGLGTLGLYLAKRFFEVAKEVVDIVLGFIVLVVSLPLLAVCALLIKLSSRGPVFYRQRRVGRGGKVFRMYKLRTMRDDAEARSGAVWAEDNDPRVVPACRWMRRSHVDELPQLINVIKGEMSLVGPRPERPELVAKLEKACPEFNKRHMVRPGITGLAQLRNGYEASVEGARRKLQVDLEYIEKRNWGTELRILAGTLTKFVNDDDSR